MFSTDRRNLFLRIPLGPLLARHPLAAIDVGSRGGFEPDLLPIAFAVDGLGFEPDPEAFRALVPGQGPWRSLRYLPHGLSGTGGPRALHVPIDPQSASLLRHDEALGRRFDKPQFVTLSRTERVETVTLAQALTQAGIADPAYLKLDIEGAELEVLQSAAGILDGLAAVKVEVSFLRVRHDQPLAADIDAFLRAKGFFLMDLIRPSHWRRRGYIVHPHSGGGPIPYSRGQLIHGDFLYFRDPESIQGQGRLIRAAALAMSYGFFDLAEELLGREGLPELLATETGLDPVANIGRASRLMGRAIWAETLIDHLRRTKALWRSFFRLVGG